MTSNTKRKEASQSLGDAWLFSVPEQFSEETKAEEEQIPDGRRGIKFINSYYGRRRKTKLLRNLTSFWDTLWLISWLQEETQ